MDDHGYRFSRETRLRALRLRKAGWSYDAIAQEVGAAKSTVARWCDPARREIGRQASRTWNKHHWPNWCARHNRRHKGERCVECYRERGQVRRALACRMWAEGVPAPEIAARLGLTTDSLYQLVHTARSEGFPFAYRKTLADPKHPEHARL